MPGRRMPLVSVALQMPWIQWQTWPVGLRLGRKRGCCTDLEENENAVLIKLREAEARSHLAISRAIYSKRNGAESGMLSRCPKTAASVVLGMRSLEHQFCVASHKVVVLPEGVSVTPNYSDTTAFGGCDAQSGNVSH